MPAPVVRGITFDKQLFTSANMAHFMYTMAGRQSGVSKGCVPTISGTTITITDGYILICGRFSQISGGTIEVPDFGTEELFYYLVYEVDLSQTASKSTFTQGSFKFVAGSSSAYPTLTKNDLDSNLTGKYQMEIAAFKRTSSGVTGFTDVKPTYEASTVIEIPATSGATSTGWTGTGPYTNTVTNSNIIGSNTPMYSIEIPANTSDTDGANQLESAALVGRVVTSQGQITLTAYGDRPSYTFYVRLRE